MVVLDRLDLIEQVQRQFTTAGLPRVTTAETKAELQQVLKEDRRGIVLTTIFRFEKAGLLNDRDNIIVLVDEAHRTTEGTLGEDMRTALPNARFFGLTGTPIADEDRNTFKLFGDPDDPGYVLNAYSMERSIADGASVPVHVETRLVDFHLDRDALDEAFDEMAEEEELTDEEREFLAGKAAHVKTIVLNPERIEAVCADIVDHFEAKVAPLGLKAQVVAYDREIVVAYESELNRILAERGLKHEVAVVMSVGTSKDEPKEFAKYALTRDAEARIKQRFNNEDDPLAFLVVTAKLLTGFDAPIEQVMYLDKPLRRHTLFQAITRTNRRYTNPKHRPGEALRPGRGLRRPGTQIAAALKAADPETGGKRPVDIDALATEFVARLEATLSPRFDGIDRTDHGFEALQAAIQRLPRRGDARDQFAADFTGRPDPVGVPRPPRGPRRARRRLQVARPGLRGHQAHQGLQRPAVGAARRQDPRAGPRPHHRRRGHRHRPGRGRRRPRLHRSPPGDGRAGSTRPAPATATSSRNRSPWRRSSTPSTPASGDGWPPPTMPSTGPWPSRSSACGRGPSRRPRTPSTSCKRPWQSPRPLVEGRETRSRGRTRPGRGHPRPAHRGAHADRRRVQARGHSRSSWTTWSATSTPSSSRSASPAGTRPRKATAPSARNSAWS